MTDRLRVYYLPRIYAREAPRKGDGKWCMESCGHTEPLITAFRCDDCFGSQVLCSICMKRKHQHHPFHRIRRWTNAGSGSFFEPAALIDLGFVLHFGHGGAECPSLDVFGSNNMFSTLTIVHTNGSHKMNIIYCSCLGQESRDLQLIDHGLFPATTSRPSTAFTFQLLRHFQIFNMASKTSAWDFHNGLVRMTNPVNPEAVPVRYAAWPVYITTILTFLAYKRTRISCFFGSCANGGY